MSFLLDTNVLSEVVKPNPDAGVLRWLHEADEDRLYVSAVTLAELWFGVERLAPGGRRTRLESWVREELADRFSDRILSMDERVAAMWGQVMAQSEAAGRRMNVMDGFLAATALVHQQSLVTRNGGDFAGTGLDLINPWNA